MLGPQLLCAATELPLTDAEVRAWNAEAVAETLVDDGLLRRRPSGYFPSPGVDPHPAVDIRGSSGGQIAILETETGRLLGSADVGRAPATVHPGAVYLHQGESYMVDSLDFEDGVAFVHAEDPGYTTFARELTDIAVTGPGERNSFGPITIGLVPVSVSNTVIGYLRRELTGEVIDFVELDMPTRTLDTKAVMCTITPEALQDNGVEPLRIPGALHAAEHAAIGLLPLVASCDRGDIGGLSTAVGPVDGSADDLRLRRLSGRRRIRRSRLPADFRRGGMPRPRRSRPASARSAARRVCSRRNVETETTRWTRRVPFACCDWCCANCSVRKGENHGDGRPLDGRPRGPAIDGAGSGTPSARRLRSNGHTTRSVSIPDR